MISYKWGPIEDLPDNWHDLASKDLQSLAAIWIEQAENLKESESLKRFNDTLRRQWAIETGIIENLYSIDRGITSLLVEKGIEASLIPHGATDKPKELVVSIIKNQEEALEGIFDFVSQKRNLSSSYIKELHNRSSLVTPSFYTNSSISGWQWSNCSCFGISCSYSSKMVSFGN